MGAFLGTNLTLNTGGALLGENLTHNMGAFLVANLTLNMGGGLFRWKFNAYHGSLFG